jgi:hypothetical protein
MVDKSRQQINAINKQIRELRWQVLNMWLVGRHTNQKAITSRL